MGKIFCLMGKSSSGKDTIFRKLLNQEALQLEPIILYTTRPIRKHEIQGREYHFTDIKTIEQYAEQGKVIERREYHTVKGIWTYCTIDDGTIDLSKHTYLIITTLEAYQQLQRYYGKAFVVPIYIQVKDGIRLERAMRREHRQVYPNYDELCRRFLADNQDFSLSKLKAADIQTFYHNENLADCLKKIKAMIAKVVSC
ncbi:MAG: guanylate kinase [Firmicutes bacterium]|nr:guanylate kinase [Bacillota bacterium]